MVILSSLKRNEDDWVFKLIPQEFDLSKVNSDPEDMEEEKKEISDEEEKNDPDKFNVASTIYELRNVITANNRSKFFDMANIDDGEWSGYAQGNNLDSKDVSFFEYQAPRDGLEAYPIEDIGNHPEIMMNNFFVELNPVIVIYMKKDVFDHTAKKYEGRLFFEFWIYWV